MKSVRLSGIAICAIFFLIGFGAYSSNHRAADLDRGISNSIGMMLMPINPGKFRMGSPAGEPGRGNDEKQHDVVISIGFHMGAHEVTQGQFAQVMEGDNPSFFRGLELRKRLGQETSSDQYPVESVTWFDAVKFCERLTSLPAEKAAGRIYRLPTEAEWEYACRAGSNTRFFFGEDESDLRFHGWVRANSDGRTHPVGLKKPNAWGMYDMYGNVWEWCSDWYAPALPSDETKDPAGPGAGRLKIIRGGDWGDEPLYCRSAERDSIQPTHTGNDRGFRVVMVNVKAAR